MIERRFVERRYACPRCHLVVEALQRVLVQMITVEYGVLIVCEECLEELRAIDPTRVVVTVVGEHGR